MGRPSARSTLPSLGNAWPQLPLIGRGAYLQHCQRLLHDAMAGRPRVVFLAGEAGIGKTRLLREVLVDVQQQGMRLCHGRCYEDLALPYFPFAESLFEPLLTTSTARSQDFDIIRRVLYQDSSGTGVAPPSGTTQDEYARARLLGAVTRATIALAQHTPLCLVIDDLHWADTSSLDLFSHLVFGLADTAHRTVIPLLILGTYRPAAPDTPLGRALRRLRREDICQELVLSGLRDAEIRALIRHLCIRRPSQQLTSLIKATTHGNPLFIQEIVRHLDRQQRLQVHRGYVVMRDVASPLPLPTHLLGALDDRSQGLSPACRHLCTFAALLGDRFSVPLLSLVSGVTATTTLDLLEEGRRQQVLQSEGPWFQFAHPLIRHVFVNALSTVQRQHLHGQIAAALQSAYAESLETHLQEIAYHFVRAGPAIPADTVALYAQRAGAQAFGLFAWADAAAYYEAALHAATTTLAPSDRATLHYRAGLAHHRNGDAGPCLEHYDQAIEAFTQAQDLHGLAHVLLEKTRVHFTLASVPYGTLVDITPLATVLDALGETAPGLRGRIAAVMSEAYRTAMQPDKAAAKAQLALRLGTESADPRLCALATFAHGLTQAQELDIQPAIESWRQTLHHARQADDPWLQGWALQRLPMLLAMQGRLAAAAQTAHEACTLAQQTNDWWGYSVARSILACTALAQGDFTAVDACTQETMIMVERSGYPWGGARALLARACGHALGGRWDAARHDLATLLEPGKVFQEAGTVMRAMVHVLQLVLQAHTELLGPDDLTDLDEVVRASKTTSYALGPLCAIIDLGDMLATPALIAPAVPPLAHAVERGVLFSVGWLCLLPRVLGVAATLQQHWAQAESSFRMALTIAQDAGARPEWGRTLFDFARMLLRRGRPQDTRRASMLAQRALDIFRDLDMQPWVLRTTQLQETLPAYFTPAVGPDTRAGPGQRSRQGVILPSITRKRTNFLR